MRNFFVVYIVIISITFFSVIDSAKALKEDPYNADVHVVFPSFLLEYSKAICLNYYTPKDKLQIQINFSQYDDPSCLSYQTGYGGFHRVELLAVNPGIINCCCIESKTSATCVPYFSFANTPEKNPCVAETFGFGPSNPLPAGYTFSHKPLKDNDKGTRLTCGAAYNKSAEGCCCRVDNTGVQSGAASCKPLGQTQSADTGEQYSENPEQYVPPAECNAAFFDESDAVSGIQYKVNSLPASGNCTELERPSNSNADTSAPVPVLKDSLDVLKRKTAKLNKLNYPTIPALIGQIINFFLGVMGAISFVLYIYAGVLWMTSAGNSEQTQSAKNIFLWTTLGLLAIFGSYIVVSQVFKFIRVGGTI